MLDWLDMFRGQTVFVVAGGPSLMTFAWPALFGRAVCAINRAYEVCPGAQMLYWSDAIFWRNRRSYDGRMHGDCILEHDAKLKAALDLGYQAGELPEEITRFRRSEIGNGLVGFDPDPTRLCTFNNSTGAALHILAHMRPARIVLLGLDMKHRDGRSHWHDGHNRYVAEDTLTSRMLPHFETLAKVLAERDIEVLNASPESAVDCWPKITHEQALRL